MREPWEWAKEDLDELVRLQVPESLTLDYKGSESLDKRNPKSATELCKDVSALANSAGGALVYGMTERNRLPTGFDSGVDPAEISVEWIQHCVYGAVEPKIENLRVHSVPLAAGRVLYVASVAQSKTAHMAGDKYYKRHDGQSIPMANYEVRDTMRRSETPDVHVQLKFLGMSNADAFGASVSLENRSLAPAPYFVVWLFVSFGLTVGLTRHWVDDGKRTIAYTYDGVEVVDEYRAIRFDWQTDRMPLFNGVIGRTGNPLHFSAVYGQRVFWEVRGPSMQTRGAYLTASEPGMWKVFPIEWEFS